MSLLTIRRMRPWSFLVIAVLAAGLVFSGTAQAGQTVNTTADGIAMDGYDPVNYFAQQKAAKGKPEFSASWNGATYWFVSAEHRDTFSAEPQKYAPQYNGWCAWAVSEGYAAEVDVVNGWLVHDDKLYVNWNESVRDALRAELASRVEKGEASWPEVESGLRDGTAEIARHANYPAENSSKIVHPQ